MIFVQIRQTSTRHNLPYDAEQFDQIWAKRVFFESKRLCWGSV